MTGEEETFLSVGLVIEKQQFDSFNEVQLSKEAKEELMTAAACLCGTDRKDQAWKQEPPWRWSIG